MSGLLVQAKYSVPLKGLCKRCLTSVSLDEPVELIRTYVPAEQLAPKKPKAEGDVEATFDPENFSFPHGTHICAMEVDTETGFVKIRKYACVDDVGTIVNPLIVEGQVHGGLAQGIAQALYEEAVYDADGNLTTGSLVDYYVPSAADLPRFTTDRTVTPATSNPLGVKGVGEAGTIASTPAVVNAIVDAVRPYGANDVRMPCSPERVWRAVHEGGAR